MKMKITMTFLTIFLMTAWAHETRAVQRVYLEREFKLRLGREALVKETGLKLRFKSLIEDSRCPEGVDCIWAGNGKIAVTLQRGRRKPVSFELNTMSEPKSIIYQGYEVTLIGLDPYPKKDVTITKGSYRATLVVRRVRR